MDPLQKISWHDEPEGWRLVTLTSLYLSCGDTACFVCTHSKACGMIGLIRNKYFIAFASVCSRQCLFVRWTSSRRSVKQFSGPQHNIGSSISSGSQLFTGSSKKLDWLVTHLNSRFRFFRVKLSFWWIGVWKPRWSERRPSTTTSEISLQQPELKTKLRW
jgi:hypothetical protein